MDHIFFIHSSVKSCFWALFFFLHHCETTLKPCLAFWFTVSVTSEFGKCLWKNWRCVEATQILSPVRLSKNSRFSHSAHVKPQSGA